MVSAPGSSLVGKVRFLRHSLTTVMSFTFACTCDLDAKLSAESIARLLALSEEWLAQSIIVSVSFVSESDYSNPRRLQHAFVSLECTAVEILFKIPGFQYSHVSSIACD